MTFPESGWIKYINILSAINETAAKKFTAYLNTHDLSTKAGRKAATDYAYAIATQYGESAAAAACEMYDAVAEASGVRLPAAEPAPTAPYGDVAKAINGLKKQDQSNEVIGESIGRLVKRAGADTTLQNAKRDGAEFAWVPHGDTCAFCLMLASNGWRKASKKTIKGDHAEHIHANCDCTFAIRFDGISNVAGYDPDKYREIYDNADGDTWQEKLNYMRKEARRANKKEINERKRELYNQPDHQMVRLAKKGNTFVVKTEDLYRYAEKITPIDGFEDIVGHGDPFSIVFRDSNGNESNVSAVEFGDILEKGGIYKGGKIRLIACQTGAGDGIVPTYLARRFNTEVLAPTEIVNVDFNGKIILANDENDAIMGIETGKWVLFGPEGRIE